MSTINIDLAADTILNVMIGQQDENEVREVVFDYSDWYTTYGSGTISLAIQRPKDEWPYEGTLTDDSTNHEATWEISETDTAYAGTGQIQLSYKVGDAKKKSVVYRFTCHKSLGALGSVVTPVQIQTFIDEVEEALQTMDGRLDDMDDQITDVKQDLATKTGLSEDAKQALLACFENVAWVDDDGQSYYSALEDALYPTVKLTSISCVYTQSGTVYDVDSLDSLKDDLVVTAHYDNGTSQNVNAYTLSGTLSDGTSAITVSYGGKTTTFNVTVTAVLYPFENGSHTFTTYPTVITVTNKNTVNIVNPATTDRDAHCNVSHVSTNGSASNQSSNYLNGGNVYFTVPAGATIRAKATIDSVDKGNDNVQMTIMVRRRDSASATTSILTIADSVYLKDIAVGQVFEESLTVENNTDIACVGAWLGHKTTTVLASVGFTFELYVNDVRYV